MPRPPAPSVPADAAGSQRPWLVSLALALAVIAAYATSFGGVMVFDDHYAIVDNPLIRDLGRLDLILFPPAEAGPVAGRPVVNLTLALNYAIGGTTPFSYHAVNLAIHVTAALLLFGLVRRTLLFPTCRSLLAGDIPAASPASRLLQSDPLLPALAIAALWALHPLQTGAVTYIIQRAESLCGMFYLLTLYCFVRALPPGVGGILHPDKVGVGFHTDAVAGMETGDHPPRRFWFVLSFIACLLGMGTKEVMAPAPLLVLLYDRTFVAGSWREAWRQRGGLHAALMATWGLLAVLVLSAESRGGSAGFGTAIGTWPYLLTQCHAIAHYLRLAVWPEPLVFDYGTPLFSAPAAVLPQALLMLALLGATIWALVKKPALGFLGAWFFLILAPSSSFVPVATQTMAEHRMYLPLVAMMVALMGSLRVLVGPYRAVILGLGLALAGGGLTAARNCYYHSELALWADTVAHRPQNARAHTNLGIALAAAGRREEAVARFEQSLVLDPGNAATHLNLCQALTALDRPAEAVPHGEEAIRLEPRSVSAHLNLSVALTKLGRTEEAAGCAEEALQITPGDFYAAAWLGDLYVELGNQAVRREDMAAAILRYRQALPLIATHASIAVRANLGNALLVSGRMDEAIAEYREALRVKPDNARVQENLARALELRNAARP